MNFTNVSDSLRSPATAAETVAPPQRVSPRTRWGLFFSAADERRQCEWADYQAQEEER